MPDERRQFRVLYRDFLFRVVDVELLSSRGDVTNLLSQFAAILSAFGFTFMLMFAPRYALSGIPAKRLLMGAFGDEEFLIGLTMTVVGIFAVIAWDVMLPNRRDSLVLGPLPIRTRTIFAARIAALGASLGLSVVALNFFVGLSLAFLLSPPGSGILGGLRSFAAYWVAMLASGLFIFSVLAAIQGTAALLFSYRMFLRISSLLQVLTLFAVLGVFFLTPAVRIPPQVNWLPSFWFLGLFQMLNGPLHPVFGQLAARALWGLLSALGAASLVYPLAYYKLARRIIAEPDLAPSNSGVLAWLSERVVNAALSKTLDRAILLFTARTLARSRQHRFLLAAYLGAALAVSIAYLKSVLFGQKATTAVELSRSVLVADLAILALMIVGARATFALPIALPANWIFRMTAVHRPSSYFEAVRKSLYILAAVPVWMLSACLFAAIWPGVPAIEHLTFVTLIGIVIVEGCLRRFRKVPYTCSYLPGGANLKMKLGVFAIAFLTLADAGTQLEVWTTERMQRFAVFLAILLVCAAWSRKRTTEAAHAPDAVLQFEDLPPLEVNALDLHSDQRWSLEGSYIDAPPFSGDVGAAG